MTDPGVDGIMLMGISCRVECLISSWGQLSAAGLIGSKGVAQCHCESLGLWLPRCPRHPQMEMLASIHPGVLQLLPCWG